jgi:hypothetical protein
MAKGIGRTADFGRGILVAQWSDASRGSSNNPEVQIIGSLLLVYCMLLPRAVCLFLSVDEMSS